MVGFGGVNGNPGGRRGGRIGTFGKFGNGGKLGKFGKFEDEGGSLIGGKNVGSLGSEIEDLIPLISFFFVIEILGF